MMRFYQTRRSVTDIARDCSGAYAIEMAIALPAFMLLMVGVWEVLLLLIGQVMLEGALRDGARYGITGYAAQGTSREESLREMVRAYTSGYLDQGRLTIITRVYPNFGSVGDTGAVAAAGGAATIPGDTGSPGMGVAGEVVLYILTYDWEFMTPLMEPFFHGRHYPITASIVVRNEPWGAGSTAPQVN
jgi:Flp pilus assembly protein TadG